LSRQHKPQHVEPRRALLARRAAVPLMSLAVVVGCKFDREANPAYGCENCVAPDRCVANFCVPGTPETPPPEPQPDAEPPGAGNAGGTAGTGGTGASTECEPGTDRFCYDGPGDTFQNPPCRRGGQTCSDEGVWGPCPDQITPRAERCNNVDDDCDGKTDEQLMSDARVCIEGRFVCQAPSLSIVEECDGADNDCDDKTDEGFDLTGDRANCGACGNACAQNETCCDGACTDTASDASHCGQCGTQCRRNTTCCGGGCVDTTSDANHCGGCGMRCPGTTSCCDGACVDTQTDRNHCGPFCLNCAVGEECCFGSCANLNSFQHCGSCERVCGTDEQCCAQQCSAVACTQ
jgi:Stigma-specific protein, Stig1